VAVFADVDLVGHGEVVDVKWLNEEVYPMCGGRETGMLENEDSEERERRWKGGPYERFYT
jgi:hypothetical protein